MSYELLVLPVPRGADVEDVAEALEVRLEGGHEVCAATPEAAELRAEIVGVACAADPLLAAAPGDAAPVIAEGDGLRLEVSERYARVLAVYAHEAEAAEALFERVFAVLSAVTAATGWTIYDPQGASDVTLDDDGRTATLEIFLSVADHLTPGGAARG